MQISLSLPTKNYILNLKKTLIYLILVLVLFNSMGYYFLFELNKINARREIQSIIQQHPAKMTILTIVDVENDREFHRIDRKEFRYKGTMFDIVREIKTGNTTVFICLHDTRESNLVAGLKRINQNKIHLAMWDQLVMIFLSQPANELNAAFSCNLIFPRIDISLKSSALPKWSPPPEFS
jgi:hypothetical protein